MKGQKEAVCGLILQTLKGKGIDYVLGGEVPIHTLLDKTDKSSIREQLCEGFESGEIQMSEQAKVKYVDNPVKLKGYVNGLLNNWIRKNPEFNCGVGYKAKNPGSRTGQSDETIKNLRLMKKAITDAKALAEIEQAIVDRLAEIKPESVVTVNAEAIPEHLHKFIK